MHKSESILKNEMHKIYRDLEIQTDHQRIGLVSINKKKGHVI